MKRRLHFLTMTLLLAPVLAGCGRQEKAGGISSGTAGTTRGASEITFQTGDGWTIHADYSPVSGAKAAVILLHQRRRSAEDWIPLVGKLNAAGIATLALDQRGAGRSQGSRNEEDAPWDTTGDIAGAVEWLKQKGFDPKHIGLAGASYGANNALIYAAAHPETPALALLSPGFDYHGLRVEPAASQYRGAILALSAAGDSVTEGGPEAIVRAASGTRLIQYEGDAHGTDLFDPHPESLDTIADFFKQRL
jgi:alpha-beta hydrolase superfamily lysophospholipase